MLSSFSALACEDKSVQSCSNFYLLEEMVEHEDVRERVHFCKLVSSVLLYLESVIYCSLTETSFFT